MLLLLALLARSLCLSFRCVYVCMFLECYSLKLFVTVTFLGFSFDPSFEIYLRNTREHWILNRTGIEPNWESWKWDLSREMRKFLSSNKPEMWTRKSTREKWCAMMLVRSFRCVSKWESERATFTLLACWYKFNGKSPKVGWLIEKQRKIMTTFHFSNWKYEVARFSRLNFALVIARMSPQRMDDDIHHFNNLKFKTHVKLNPNFWHKSFFANSSFFSSFFGRCQKTKWKQGVSRVKKNN